MNLGNKIKSGGEFNVFEYTGDDVIKIPRFSLLMSVAFGDFRRKNEEDLAFLQEYFSQFLPPTEIIELGRKWAIRQKKIDGTFFADNPRMSPPVVKLFRQAERVFQETGRIPDLSNPGNLICERQTGRLFLVDTSVLGRKKWWPPGFCVTRLLGRILYDEIRRRLRTGF
jgi:hypothetical protein